MDPAAGDPSRRSRHGASASRRTRRRGGVLCGPGEAVTSRRRPKPWAETSRQGLTRYVWRFERRRHWTPFYEDPEEARADATAQISQQLQGTWRDRSGRRMLLEEWIDVWVQMRDVEPTTLAKDRYLVEFHILPQFQGSELGSLAFEEIEAWEQAIPTRISATGRPYAGRSPRWRGTC
jgi:hypothetical protein